MASLPEDKTRLKNQVLNLLDELTDFCQYTFVYDRDMKECLSKIKEKIAPFIQSEGKIWKDTDYLKGGATKAAPKVLEADGFNLFRRRYRNSGLNKNEYLTSENARRVHEKSRKYHEETEINEGNPIEEIRETKITHRFNKSENVKLPTDKTDVMFDETKDWIPGRREAKHVMFHKYVSVVRDDETDNNKKLILTDITEPKKLSNGAGNVAKNEANSTKTNLSEKLKEVNDKARNREEESLKRILLNELLEKRKAPRHSSEDESTSGNISLTKNSKNDVKELTNRRGEEMELIKPIDINKKIGFGNDKGVKTNLSQASTTVLEKPRGNDGNEEKPIRFEAFPIPCLKDVLDELQREFKKRRETLKSHEKEMQSTMLDVQVNQAGRNLPESSNDKGTKVNDNDVPIIVHNIPIPPSLPPDLSFQEKKVIAGGKFTTSKNLIAESEEAESLIQELKRVLEKRGKAEVSCLEHAEHKNKVSQVTLKQTNETKVSNTKKKEDVVKGKKNAAKPSENVCLLVFEELEKKLKERREVELRKKPLKANLAEVRLSIVDVLESLD